MLIAQVTSLFGPRLSLDCQRFQNLPHEGAWHALGSARIICHLCVYKSCFSSQLEWPLSFWQRSLKMHLRVCENATVLVVSYCTRLHCNICSPTAVPNPHKECNWGPLQVLHAGKLLFWLTYCPEIVHTQTILVNTGPRSICLLFNFILKDKFSMHSTLFQLQF